MKSKSLAVTESVVDAVIVVDLSSQEIHIIMDMHAADHHTLHIIGTF